MAIKILRSEDTKEVTVKLPAEQIRFIKELAENEGLTFDEVLSRSINAEKFFVAQRRAKRKVLAEDAKFRIREVVHPE